MFVIKWFVCYKMVCYKICQIEEYHPVYSVLSVCYPGSPLWWNPRFSSTLPCSSHTVHWFPCCYSLKAPGIWPPPELCLHLLSVSSAGMLFYQVATWCVPSLLQLFTEMSVSQWGFPWPLYLKLYLPLTLMSPPCCISLIEPITLWIDFLFYSFIYFLLSVDLPSSLSPLPH